MLHWLRRGLLAVVKLAVVLAISFFGLELLLLAFNDLVFRSAQQIYDPDLGYKVRPGYDWFGHPTNAFGFNDRDYPLDRRPGTYRVLIVGDSFNWAGGYQANYVELVERRMDEALGPGRVEVINVGYPGQDTKLELGTLEKYGLKYQPDLVVLGFFAGNDFFDANPWQRKIAIGPAFMDLDLHEGHERTFFGQPLVARSRLWLFIEARRRERAWLAAQEQAAGTATAPVTTADAAPTAVPAPVAVAALPTAAAPATGNPLPITNAAAGNAAAASPTPYAFTPQYAAIMRSRIHVADPAWAEELEIRKTEAFKHLSAMRRLLAEQDIGFMVMVYPDEFQVDTALRQSLLDRDKLDASDYRWNLPQDLVAGWCAAEGAECHDLLPAFEAAHRAGRRQYLLNDSHWNEAGNALAADEIAAQLIPKARAFLDRRP
jgi:hypothetical protein